VLSPAASTLLCVHGIITITPLVVVIAIAGSHHVDLLLLYAIIRQAGRQAVVRLLLLVRVGVRVRARAAAAAAAAGSSTAVALCRRCCCAEPLLPPPPPLPDVLHAHEVVAAAAGLLLLLLLLLLLALLSGDGCRCRRLVSGCAGDEGGAHL
jgi:hypothetical protein